MGILSQIFFDYTGAATRKWLVRFPYTRTVVLSGALFVGGVYLAGLLTVAYVRNGYRLIEGPSVNNLGVTGLLLMIVGFMTFTFALMLHSTVVAVGRR
jgi:hypothetical protein